MHGDSPPSTKADDLVERLSNLGEVDASFLIKALRQGEISLFESAFCKFTGLNLLRRILFEPGGEALVLLCRAVDVGSDTFSELFELSRRAKDQEEEVTVNKRTARMRSTSIPSRKTRNAFSSAGAEARTICLP